jgi:sugar phosphate isomerase/epimerase
MNQISFITANYVARDIGYHMTEGWMQGDTATQNAFRPIESFEKKFEQMLGNIKAMGFNAIDLWGAHLNPDWASAEHLKLAKILLAKHDIKVLSLANGVGSLEMLEGFCKIATALGVPILAGGAAFAKSQRKEVIAVLKTYGIKLGLENHPEKTPAELLTQIGDGADGYIGASPDTGWWGTQDYNAATALRELKSHLFTVHLKDVKAAGGHETCRFGQGIVDIKACIETLKAIGYQGSVGIEHEPEHFDPTQDVIESKAMLESWLKA